MLLRKNISVEQGGSARALDYVPARAFVVARPCTLNPPLPWVLRWSTVETRDCTFETVKGYLGKVDLAAMDDYTISRYSFAISGWILVYLSKPPDVRRVWTGVAR